LAEALAAYHGGDLQATLLVRTDLGEPESMPVSLFFRTDTDLRGADRIALGLARGRVLDGGAGVGSMALLAQESGLDVTAAEIIPEAVQIMEERGVHDPRLVSLADLPQDRSYDTILLLMNGAALAGTLGSFPRFLRQLDGLLAPGGQVLMDSTDLEPADEKGVDGRYPGEVHFQMQFKEVKGAPFPQLFLDPSTLARLAASVGWEAEVVWAGEDGEYLARITRLQDR
jgi:cyclopropane fatty-acyl-phospholipid synthase-like methyltransferase